MRAKITLFIVFGVLAITQAHADTVNLSLDPADWTDYAANTSYSKATIGGNLRFTSHAYRGTVQVKTAYNFNWQNATLQYKWRINGNGSYCWTGAAPQGWWTLGTNLTTGWSWYSILVVDNRWIYAEMTVHPDKTLSYDYSYDGYGQGGINHGAFALNDTQWDSLTDTFSINLLLTIIEPAHILNLPRCG